MARNTIFGGIRLISSKNNAESASAAKLSTFLQRKTATM